VSCHINQFPCQQDDDVQACMHACMHTYIHTYILIYKVEPKYCFDHNRNRKNSKLDKMLRGCP